MDKKIGFWKVDDPYGQFSNWWMCTFTYKGVTFLSSEQALMWEKAKLFGDEETAAKILKTTSQKAIKDLGREVKNYVDLVWAERRYNVMVDILIEKFGQNEVLKEALMNTEDADLYEASPFDKIWGIGSTDVNDIHGKNLLGRALMHVRSYLTARENCKG